MFNLSFEDERDAFVGIDVLAAILGQQRKMNAMYSRVAGIAQRN